ncbi:MAG: MerR family transcriptional regulator [Firmicutes bacterium]|nr:MerR family transcriptional regulator [Bacillota bacterium]
MKLYRVGEVCRRTGLSRKHLFQYKQIVPAVATEYEGAYKLYDEEGLRKLEKIALLRQIGLHKPQILAILDDRGQERVLLLEQKQLLYKEMQRIEARLALLEETLESIDREEE